MSIFGAILASNLFMLWTSENVIEAWMEFTEAKPCSAKKALYLELMLQLALYLFMSISFVDWSGLLIVLAGYYLDAKRWNFLLMVRARAPGAAAPAIHPQCASIRRERHGC